jgi:tetratricopeptide (TPR) repeat protein
LSDQIRSVFKISEINRWAKKEADRETLLQRYPEIEATLRQVERDPSDLGAKRRLAEFFVKKQLYRRALQHYSELSVMLPEDEDVQLALAQIWEYQGAHAIALRHALNAVELSPDSIRANTVLGMVYLHRDEPGKASKAFLAVLKQDPENGPVLANTGYTYLQLKQWETAVGYLEAALKINPDSVEVRNNLGIARTYLGDEEGALQEFLQVNRPAAAYNNLGVAYLAQQNWSKAHDAFQAALAWEPDYVKARLNLLEAESYLPSPSVVHLSEFNTRLAWLGSSWEKHAGISNQGIFNLPQLRLPQSREYLRFPHQSLEMTMESGLQQTPFPGALSSQATQAVPADSGAAAVEKPSVTEEGAGQEAVGLSSVDPLPFTVKGTGKSDSMTPPPLSKGFDSSGPEPPSGVRTADLGQLLNHAIESTLATQKSRPSKPATLAGVDLLSLLLKRPNPDWNKLADLPATGSAGLADLDQQNFPAQVWLPPRGGQETEIDSPELHPSSLPRLASRQPVTFPFQLSPLLMDYPEPIVTASQEFKSEVFESTEPSEPVREETQKTAVMPSPPDPEPVEQQPQLVSFDQFAATRKKALINAEDPMVEPSEAASPFEIPISGLAGLAGLFLILISLGSSRLYVRWRSPLKKSRSGGAASQ